MNSYFLFLKENIIENKFNFYLTVYLIAISIPSFFFNKLYYMIPFIIFFTIKILLDFKSTFLLNGELYTQYKLEKDNESINQETNRFRKKINDLYIQYFSKTEFNSIFDKKIFTIIDLVNDLNKNNLHGVIKLRVQKLINNSLKIYLVNIESASKMIQAHNNADIDFKNEIQNLLEQNNIIMIKLKEFITKLIMLNDSTEEFKKLLNTFEYNLVSLDIIKNVRKDLE